MKAMEAIAISTFYEIGTRKYPGDCTLGGEWPLAVPCIGGDTGPGIVDIEALKALVDFFSAKGHLILVIFNMAQRSKGHMMMSGCWGSTSSHPEEKQYV